MARPGTAEVSLGETTIAWQRILNKDHTTVSTKTFFGKVLDWDDVIVALTIKHKKSSWDPGASWWLVYGRIHKVEYTSKEIICYFESPGSAGFVDQSKLQEIKDSLG